MILQSFNGGAFEFGARSFFEHVHFTSFHIQPEFRFFHQVNSLGVTFGTKETPSNTLPISSRRFWATERGLHFVGEQRSAWSHTDPKEKICWHLPQRPFFHSKSIIRGSKCLLVARHPLLLHAPFLHFGIISGSSSLLFTLARLPGWCVTVKAKHHLEEFANVRWPKPNKASLLSISPFKTYKQKCPNEGLSKELKGIQTLAFETCPSWLQDWVKEVELMSASGDS